MFKKISLYLTSFILAFTLIGSAYAVTLKASHQWPGTPRADGSYDPRHEMVQIIADEVKKANVDIDIRICLLYTSPSPRDATLSRMPSSA